jgi:PAS domain S-box-containing protein
MSRLAETGNQSPSFMRTPRTSNDIPDFAAEGGKTGALLRTTDWSATALGPIEDWSQSLRTSVGIMLHSGHPMYVAWGPSLNLLFNDAYLQILGARAKNPADVFGKPFKEVWPDVWPEAKPRLDRAMDGISSWHEDHPFSVTRNGYPEQMYVTFSSSPIREESGAVAGVFCACIETTGKVLAARQRDEALQELAASNEKLRLATDAAQLGFFEHDLQTGEVSCSKRTKEHFGLPPDAAIPEDMFVPAVHTDDRDLGQRETNAFLSPAVDGYHESEYRTISLEDERERWIVARGRLFVDETGQPLRLVGTTMDITERKQAEQRERQVAAKALAAAEANAKFRTFFEQGSYFAAVMMLDGTVIEANRRSLDACGFTREQIIGRKFWECGWWNRSEELAEMVRHGARLAAAGQLFRRETVYFVADGSQRALDLVIAPVTDDTGQVLFIAPTGIDITERKQVEEQLRLLDRMSEITRAAADPKAIMMQIPWLLGEYLHATRCAYADVESDNDRFTIRQDWIADDVASTAGSYSLNRFGARVAAAMRQGRTLVLHDVQRELAPDEGADSFLAVDIKAIICCPLVKDGRLIAMMGVHQDRPRNWTANEIQLLEEVAERSWVHIERLRAIEALREADRRKTEFLATLAHELRNPLAPIQTGLDVMRLGGGNPAAISKVRDMMERQLGHMVRLVNDLLDVSRISRGQVDLRKEMVSLKSIVASAVETSMPLIEAGEHQLNVDVPDDPLQVEVDPTRMAQVLSNLLNNAAKYTPNGGRIELSAHCDGSDVLISVTDTGVGIPAESLASVFEMFAQIGQYKDRAQGGLGIGLTLARRLVELHGGQLSASSEGPGKGSCFTVRLPLAGSGGVERIAAVGSRRTANTDRSDGVRVMIVDDNVDAAESLSVLLEIGGHEVRIANDGYRALLLAQEFRPQIVFLDIGMPGMNGYDVARRLRILPGMEHVTLVAVTGWGAENDRARASEAGFDQHLTKPAALSDVNAILSTLFKSISIDTTI